MQGAYALVQGGSSASNLSGGRVLTNLSTRIKKLGEKYKLSLPSASRVRKIGATSVAMNIGDSSTAHIVTRQMSHSASTEANYYQAIVGDRHALSAYDTMTALREGLCDDVVREGSRRFDALEPPRTSA